MTRLPLIPLERRIAVTLHLRSGALLPFTVDDITQQTRENELTAINVTKQVGFPFYVRLADISAIVTERVWASRGLRWWEIGVFALLCLAAVLWAGMLL